MARLLQTRLSAQWWGLGGSLAAAESHAGTHAGTHAGRTARRDARRDTCWEVGGDARGDARRDVGGTHAGRRAEVGGTRAAWAPATSHPEWATRKLRAAPSPGVWRVLDDCVRFNVKSSEGAKERKKVYSID